MVNSLGGVSLFGTTKVDSSIITTSDDSGKGALAGNIRISSAYTYIDKGYIAVSATGHGGSIKMDPNIFSSGNVLNDKLFVSNGGIPPYTKGGRGQYSKGNYIVIENDKGSSNNVSVSGSLLNLSGDMANLPPANFKSKEIDNSCQLTNRESLSLSGSGGTSSSALDRMIYGY